MSTAVTFGSSGSLGTRSNRPYCSVYVHLCPNIHHHSKNCSTWHRKIRVNLWWDRRETGHNERMGEGETCIDWEGKVTIMWDRHTDLVTNNMFPLTTENVCVYLCVCMSSLTLTASIMALYVLISLTKHSENGGINRDQSDRQEGRQGVEQSARPLCLNTQL